MTGDAWIARASAGAARATPILLLVITSAAFGQDIEPRAYANAPVGVNFLRIGYAYTQGGLSFDPAVPVTDARLQTSTGLLAYVRTFGLAGMSAKFDAAIAFGSLNGSASSLAGSSSET